MSEMAGALGESDQSASNGVRSSIATLLGGMAINSRNPNMLREALQLAPPVAEGISWSNAASVIGDPGSPALSVAGRLMSLLFGDSAGLVTNALGVGTHLPTGKISSLLAVAAPIVMGFLSRRVRHDGMSMTGLGDLLERESPSIRSALPRGVTDLLWSRERGIAAGSPAVYQTASAAPRSRAWLLPLLLLIALIPAISWLARHTGKSSKNACGGDRNGESKRARTRP